VAYEYSLLGLAFTEWPIVAGLLRCRLAPSGCSFPLLINFYRPELLRIRAKKKKSLVLASPKTIRALKQKTVFVSLASVAN